MVCGLDILVKLVSGYDVVLFKTHSHRGLRMALTIPQIGSQIKANGGEALGARALQNLCFRLG